MAVGGNATRRSLYFRERFRVSIVEETDLVQGTNRTGRKKKKFLIPPVFETLTVQPIVSRYTDCFIPLSRYWIGYSMGFRVDIDATAKITTLSPARYRIAMFQPLEL